MLGIQLLNGEGEQPTVRGNAELKVAGWKQSLSVPLHMTALVELAAESAARNRRPLGHNTWLRSLQASRVQLKIGVQAHLQHAAFRQHHDLPAHGDKVP